MQFNNINWNDTSYNKYINYLISIKEDKYQKFTSKLTKTKYEMLGIRIPTLRLIAKDIIKGNYLEFLKYSKCMYFEEVMIKGLVIASIKDEEIFDKYFIEYIKLIDNWSLCDTFCNSIKIIRKYPNKYFGICKKLCQSKDEYFIRVGLITILSHFVTDNYIDDIYEILDNLNSDTYYVNMGAAWLLCDLMIKFQSKTLKYLENTELSDEIINLGIKKMRESFRINKELKEDLLKFKR